MTYRLESISIHALKSDDLRDEAEIEAENGNTYPEAYRVWIDSHNESDSSGLIGKIVKWVSDTRPTTITRRDMQTAFRNDVKSASDLDRPIEYLVGNRYIEPGRKTSRVGRPSETYDVNLDMFVRCIEAVHYVALNIVVFDHEVYNGTIHEAIPQALAALEPDAWSLEA